MIKTEDEAEEAMWDELEEQQLNKKIAGIQNIEPAVVIKKSEPLKIIIFKKLIKYNRFNGAPFESWTKIPNANFSIIPNTMIFEYQMCRWILNLYSEGEFLVRTWQPYTPWFKLYRKRKRPKGFFTFWKGVITKQYFQRYGGSLLGYLKPSIPIGLKHLYPSPPAYLSYQ
jgi:hypothetical protein